MIRRSIGVIAAIFLVIGACAPVWANEAYTESPVPSWVTPIGAPAGSKDDGDHVSRGVRYLLTDRQLKVDEGGQSSFFHTAYRIANETGLDDWSDFSIVYDPSYERVMIHGVFIWRGNKRMNALPGARIQVFEQQKDQLWQSYDNEKTIHVLLADTRVGDVVEFSYTIEGENPALAGHLTQRLDLQWDIPVDQVYRRVHFARRGRALHYRRIAKAPDPVITAAGDGQDFVWQRTNLAAAPAADGNVPGSYEHYDGVALTDAQDWAEVARVSASFYQKAIEDRPSLRKVADAIRAQHQKPEEQIIAALDYVENNIRYVSIDIGPGGFIPNPASLTLQRRYGDCKDKTVLLVSLLRILGIEAYPALVDTTKREALSKELPALALFDHVVTMARLGSVDYWLDGTMINQAGNLAHRYQADYGTALVLKAGTHDLTPVKVTPFAPAARRVEEVMDLTAGPGKAAPFMVKTTYFGADADGMRAELAQRTLNEIQKRYRDYYATWYPGIRTVGALSVSRDDGLNTVTITEHYTLKDPWEKDRGNLVARYHRGELRGDFAEIDAAERQAPLALTYPLEREEILTLLYPPDASGWRQDAVHDKVSNSHFSFDYSFEGKDGKAVHHFLYRTRARAVPSAALASYKEDLDNAIDYTGDYFAPYNFSPTRQGPLQRAYWVLGVALLWTFAARGRLYLRRRGTRKLPTYFVKNLGPLDRLGR